VLLASCLCFSCYYCWMLLVDIVCCYCSFFIYFYCSFVVIVPFLLLFLIIFLVFVFGFYFLCYSCYWYLGVVVVVRFWFCFSVFLGLIILLYVDELSFISRRSKQYLFESSAVRCPDKNTKIEPASHY